MHRKKCILFCGNGMSSEILKDLKDEYRLLMISEFKNDVGLNYLDDFIYADSKKPEVALEAAKQFKANGYDFDAVLSLCWDSSVSVARIAHYFNLIGISENAAIEASNKAIRSGIFEKNNIAAPKYRQVNSLQELKIAVKEIVYPIVLKPLELSSSKGVIRVNEPNELYTAYQYCMKYIKDKESSLIVNEFIKGTEYSLEGLMINNKLHTTGISQRVFHYEKYKPNFVESGDILPAGISEKLSIECSRITESAAAALGIENSVVKADLIITDDNRIFIFELTPRLGGPRFGTEMIPLHNGTNILKAAIKQALGEEVDLNDLKPKFNKGVVNRSIFPEPGIINSIEGLDKIKTLPGYYDYKWWGIEPLEIGSEIKNPENGCGGVGYLIITGEDRETAIKNADLIEGKLVIKTKKGL